MQRKIIILLLLVSFFLPLNSKPLDAQETDLELYEKYLLYKDYEKKELYEKYKQCKGYGKYQLYKAKYHFETAAERRLYKDKYEKYKLYKKNPAKYSYYKGYWDYYKKYRNYKNKYKEYKEEYKEYGKYDECKIYGRYQNYKKNYKFDTAAERHLYKDRYEKYKDYKKNPSKYWYYADYKSYYNGYKNYKNKYKKYKEKYLDEVKDKFKEWKKYKKYNQDKYDEYKQYGQQKYKDGYNRYLVSLNPAPTANSNYLGLGEATLGGGPLGPEITVGLWSKSRSDSKDEPFKIKANKDYVIKNDSGSIIAQVPAGTITKVAYSSDGNLNVFNSISPTFVNKIVYFEAADGNNNSMIFDAYKPGSSFDQYRGSMQIRYSTNSKKLWVINKLPLEHYVWGIGEITGTGDMNYNRLMTTSFRTYGYWKIKYSTQHATEGFTVNATPGNQLYYGYDWETSYPRIKEGATYTQGKIVMYGNEIAITPYSSWTDGRTRSFAERWGSSSYPWCQSVDDPYGKHPSKSTSSLVSEGNHMVGLSAHGALSLAGDHGWDWERILNYYFTGIRILKAY